MLRIRIAMAALLATGLASCGPASPPASQPGASAAAPPPRTIFETMNQSLMPQANQLWELAGSLYDDEGELDAAQLTDAQWQQMQATAAALEQVAIEIAEAPALRVAPEGVKIQNEGMPGTLGVAEIQAAIDADGPAFRGHSRQLAGVARDFIAAAQARDAAAGDAASNRLNEVCTACHNQFWYPGQAGP